MDLGPLEERVLEALWRSPHGLSVREVRSGLGDGLAYTTVMTTLDRLYKKGLLERQRDGRAFRYAARASREALAAGALAPLARPPARPRPGAADPRLAGGRGRRARPRAPAGADAPRAGEGARHAPEERRDELRGARPRPPPRGPPRRLHGPLACSSPWPFPGSRPVRAAPRHDVPRCSSASVSCPRSAASSRPWASPCRPGSCTSPAKPARPRGPSSSRSPRPGRPSCSGAWARRFSSCGGPPAWCEGGKRPAALSPVCPSPRRASRTSSRWRPSSACGRAASSWPTGCCVPCRRRSSTVSSPTRPPTTPRATT